MEKTCKNCAITSSSDNFHRHSGMDDGHINVCKTCRHEYCKTWRKNNRESLKIKKAKYHSVVKDDINSKRREERKQNPSKYKESNLQHNFGITLSQYNAMLVSQNFTCAVCKYPETSKHQSGKVRDLSVDHCHSTGAIRGLLCGKCNKGIGLFQDNKKLLEQAIKYLERVGN